MKSSCILDVEKLTSIEGTKKRNPSLAYFANLLFATLIVQTIYLTSKLLI